MCTQIYLGADHPLPTIPRPELNPDNASIPLKPGAPAIWVQLLDPALSLSPGAPPSDPGMGAPALDVEALVRRWLEPPFLYYVGSFMGCGCPFGYGRTATAQPRPEWDERWKAFQVAYGEAKR